MPHRRVIQRPRQTLTTFEARWPALVILGLAWAAVFLSDGILNLGNLALLLVLGSAISGLWLSALASVGVSALSVAAFNWWFVPPRFTFHVQLHQDVLLLITMLGVTVVVSYLMSQLRAVVAAERMHASRSEDLRLLGEAMRETPEPLQQAQLLVDLLDKHSLCASSVMLLAVPQTVGAEGLDTTQKQGLRVCAQEGVALGAGTGRHDNMADLYLPLRGRAHTYGAAMIREMKGKATVNPMLQDYLQQACDLLGLELERLQAFSQAQQAQQQAQHQSLRNTLLTAISHDYRTPLASLIGAASAIHDQAHRLSVDKIEALSQTVLNEAQHLTRMTTNTLQLARLDSSPLSVKKDWESVHEFLGSVMAQVRQRFPNRTFQVSVPEQVPLIHCDALLLVQLFENLLENAIKYSPHDRPIRVEVSHDAAHVHVRVMDEGAGIDEAWKQRVFEPFERAPTGGGSLRTGDATEPEKVRRGVGVGLAVCQAIAKVHAASIQVQNNVPTGTVMCVSFPVLPQPSLSGLPN